MGEVGEDHDGAGVLVGWGGQEGNMAAGVEAVNEFGSRGGGDAHPVWPDGDAAVMAGPAPDLGAVEAEATETQNFGGGESVGGGRDAGEAAVEQIGDGWGPRGGVIAVRSPDCRSQ